MWQKPGYFELVLVGSGLILLISILFVILYFHFNKKIVVKELEQNKIKLLHQKDLLKNEIKAIEKERRRIAQDLHDEIGANLAYIGLNMAQITKDCSGHNAIEKIINCHEQLKKSINDVRRISHDLLPPTLEMFGLSPALKEYIDNIDSNFSIKIQENDNFIIEDQDISLQLYRVILELIGNAIKHSQGNRINIELNNSEDNSSIIKVSDNGIGYNFEEMQMQDGLGLKNIISRLETIGSEFYFNSLNNGSEVTIIIKN